MSGFRVRQSNSDAVVEANGELDIANVQQLLAAFSEAESLSTERVVIDLTNVTFIDSSVVSALSRLQRRLEGVARHAALVCPDRHPEVAKVLTMMGINTVIPFIDPVD